MFSTRFMSTLAVFVVYLTTLNVANASILPRGGPEVCTDALDGTGCTNYQVTKDCCAAVNQKAYFNEVSYECWPYSGPAGNSVDTGGMVKCCSSRGKGSAARIRFAVLQDTAHVNQIGVYDEPRSGIAQSGGTVIHMEV